MSTISRVRAFARRHDLWREGTRVIAAVSGGSDSVALLLLLRDLAASGDVVLDAAAHLNHGIRGAAAEEDEDFCHALCGQLGLPLVTAREDVPGIAAREGRSIEVAARDARHRFLDEVRRRRGADAVATAHTEDDQAETVLLRLVRGMGGRGLAGIAPRRDHLIRPLLTCTRAELRGELRVREQIWREDATNADLANPRNRIRHELLPYLAAHFNPSISRAVARLAEVARADESWLAGVVQESSRDVLQQNGDVVTLDLVILTGLPEGLARRIARQALETANPGRSYGVEEIELVLAVAAGRQTAAEISGWRVERFHDSAVLIRKAPSTRPRRRGTGLAGRAAGGVSGP